MVFVRHTGEMWVKESNSASSCKVLSSGAIAIYWYERNFDRHYRIKEEDKGEFIELHFQFNGLSETAYQGKKLVMSPNSQSIFYINNFAGEHDLYKDGLSPFTVFEVKIGVNTIKDFFSAEFWNELSFLQNLMSGTTAFVGSVRHVTPQMRAVVDNICNCPFKGIMEEAYLEAKVAELFLLQADSHKPGQKVGLKRMDMERVVAAKEFIDKNYQAKIRITDLAKIAGTNQHTLAMGFKALFGTTIFCYYNNLRMEEAKRLLLNEKKQVCEVSDEMGYKNPQHFTVAFKKKFGVLPKELRGV